MPGRQHLPSYREHKQSGQAIVTLPDGMGGRRDVLLGKYDTAESRAEYERVVAEWLAAGRRLTPAGKPGAPGVSVNEVVLAFLRHAETHYRRPDGTPTGEVREFKLALRPVVHLYGTKPAAEFGPLAMKAVRELMVKGYKHPKHGHQDGVSRGVVNQRMGRIKRTWKWAVSEELVPAQVLLGLQSVRGLQKGRTEARETEPVKPVAPETVEATLPYLNRHVRAMVNVQLLTGCRPGELVLMRPQDIDRTGDVWQYRPGSDEGTEGRHKTAHHGNARVILIGPRAQAELLPFLEGRSADAYIFSPREAKAEWNAARRAARKSKVQPSQVYRKKERPKKVPGERYTPSSYAHAITAAVEKANREREEKLPAVDAWHPHQLRHTRGTDVRKRHGLEAAQVLLGHSKADVTQIYAERDLTLAAKVAAEIG